MKERQQLSYSADDKDPEPATYSARFFRCFNLISPWTFFHDSVCRGHNIGLCVYRCQRSPWTRPTRTHGCGVKRTFSAEAVLHLWWVITWDWRAQETKRTWMLNVKVVKDHYGSPFNSIETSIFDIRFGLDRAVWPSSVWSQEPSSSMRGCQGKRVNSIGNRTRRKKGWWLNVQCSTVHRGNIWQCRVHQRVE